MNNAIDSPYSSFESPTSSESSYSYIHSHPMDSDSDNYLWASHYQQAVDRRNPDTHYYWSATPHDSTGNWIEPQAHSYSPASSLPLHAPAPITGHLPMLFTDIETSSQPHSSPVVQEPISPTIAPPHTYMNTFSVRAPLQATFPTPCELLNEFHTAGDDSASGAYSPTGSVSDSGILDIPRPCSTSTSASTRKRDSGSKAGFSAPEAEPITSHEKKRQYLECLEQYVQYLHEQLELVGAQPVPIERVSTYRGLSSRSIRTLLVHMENSTSKLNAKTQTEEERFLVLRDAYFHQEGGGSGAHSDPYTAASVEAGEYYSGITYRPHSPLHTTPPELDQQRPPVDEFGNGFQMQTRMPYSTTGRP
ncbi:hypothetical protein BDP27DRAFT_1402814 [Rhodocollybia butyracea]|uniref:Uncharacterized protein n=1 Tax=Rhodocollybia butyracea TaxID=206335 RepID=A0A9P5PTK0_9AGAR|nr:hypothetical protein BDP27DRAFT_1402814 [Rhodocollybia butyracea]